MAKFSGIIGFVKDEENPVGSGNYFEVVTERKYRGDVLDDTYKWQDQTKVNENFNISNRFSIVADTFAMENIGSMRYIEYLGEKWKIMTFTVTRPRIMIWAGGIYNG